MTSLQLIRLAEHARQRIRFTLDGAVATALAGDTVLTAILTNTRRLRSNEFDGGARGGFCLMGACQDCWVTTAGGDRLRACTTFIGEGMQLRTRTYDER